MIFTYLLDPQTTLKNGGVNMEKISEIHKMYEIIMDVVIENICFQLKQDSLNYWSMKNMISEFKSIS